MPATLEQVRSRIRADQDASHPHLERFAERLFHKADPAFLDTFDPDALVAMARGSLQFLEAHGGAEAASVEVLDPSFHADGWEAPYTVVRLAMRDRPFVVDSVRAALRREGTELYHLLHPIYRVTRGKDGSIADLGRRGSGGHAEAFELYFVERLEDEERREALRARVQRVLDDVILATDAYHDLRAKVHDVASDLRRLAKGADDADKADEFEEYAAFLEWLDDDNFVFLGYREYDIVEQDGTRMLVADSEHALGILSRLGQSAYREPVPIDELPEGLRERVVGGRPLIVTKTNALSTVHRPSRMDYLGVKKLPDGRTVQGERRFIGLFTSKALGTPVDETPILRRKLRQVLDRDEAEPGSHDYKEIVTVFNSMPRSELFWSEVEQLHRDIRTVMGLEQERGVRLTLRRDPLQRGVGLMVIMPRERFNARVREAIQNLLAERLDAEHVDYQLAMGEDHAQVRFHFFFVTATDPEDVNVAALEREVAELTRSWNDHLQERLLDRHGGAEGRRLADRWLPALDERYKADIPPAQALRDIVNLEALGDGAVRVDLLAPTGDKRGDDVTLLKIYHPHATLVLSEVLPVLENLGLRVLEQVAYPLAHPDGWRGIDVFRVQDMASGGALDVRRDRERLIEALRTLMDGNVESDRLNRLVLRAGLNLREVALLRAYQMYYAQISAETSRSFVNDTLLAQPDVVRTLLDAFRARFDPEAPGGAGPVTDERREAIQEADEAFRDALGAVASLPEDRVLRGLHDLMSATVRTNYFAGSDPIAFKIASEQVAAMPDPRPLFEIGVAGYGVEGTHLRGGLVARGGIRWSDRPDDFRTEVLGLMKTQMTKNAVIVPVGSKGGFIVKHAPDDRDELRHYVRRQYAAYVGALLELSDNRVQDEVVHPAGMVVHDGPDPYLVVAADKGTATFSDLANEVSARHGFWLGDAFASGGSNGYDHKAEGITARGTWESVRRHLLALGIDPEKDEFDVAGIGDMSGDVFGNGMVHAPGIRLLAAFNHLHIFLDPNPDVPAAFEERKRLFALPRSSWTDYDTSLISVGGGVFPRSAKAIPLAEPVRKVLGVTAESLSGQDLIRAILRTKVQLLWNGGIGTYVKASSERHADVGDSANDGVRIDANELGAAVVGEGGNLGFTQEARIEAARAGVRLDTDAIHNVGGVDMSDREVNLKILLQPLVAEGELSDVQRNRLLRDMTDEVSELVLADAARQWLAISLSERRALADPRLFASLQEYLEDRGGLDSLVEDLPDAKARSERIRTGVPYVRPEIAILLAYTKMGVYRRLLETDFPSDPHLVHLLIEYFPTPVRKRHREAVERHPLRREIVATQATNLVVDLLGITFVHRTIRDSGGTPVEILRAALMAMDLMDVPGFFAEFEARAGIDVEGRFDALHEMVRATEGLVSWILLNDLGSRDMAAFVNTYRGPLADLQALLPTAVAGADKRILKQRAKRFAQRGFNETEAMRIAALDFVPASVGAIEVARSAGVPLEEAAKRFYGIGERLRLGWLRDRLADLPTVDKWEKIALAGLVMDLRRAQQRLTAGYVDALAEQGGRLTPERYLASLPRVLDRFDQSLAEIEKEGALDLAAGTVLVRTLMQATRT